MTKQERMNQIAAEFHYGPVSIIHFNNERILRDDRSDQLVVRLTIRDAAGENVCGLDYFFPATIGLNQFRAELERAAQDLMGNARAQLNRLLSVFPQEEKLVGRICPKGGTCPNPPDTYCGCSR